MKGILYPIGLVIALCMGFMIGNHNAEKHYQAACAWSDLCRYAYDRLYWDANYTEEDIHELYMEYAGDLDCLKYTITRQELEEYYKGW